MEAHGQEEVAGRSGGRGDGRGLGAGADEIDALALAGGFFEGEHDLQQAQAFGLRAWRIPESTLLLAGLLGGWPGALLAQHLLRHKSSKPSFLAEFWATVALNVLAFAFTPLFEILVKG